MAVARDFGVIAVSAPLEQAATFEAMELWLMDLSSIRFQWGVRGSALNVLSSRGEPLGIIQVPRDMALEEAALQGFDAALKRGKVERVTEEAGRVRYQIALYNPYTAEVSVGALPKTRVFTDRSALKISADGVAARLEDSGLVIGERVLDEIVGDFKSVSRTLATYEDLVSA